MKKTFLALMCMASLAVMTACGGGNNTKATTTNENEPQPAEQTATEQPAANEEVTLAEAAAYNVEDFSAQLKEACGFEAITFPEMTKIKVERPTNSEYHDFFMCSPVSGIDKETVQRAYFEAITKIADGNKVYGIGMNGRGDDSFKTYDEYADFIKKNGIYSLATYSYDLNGQRIDINCGVSFGDFSFSAKLK